MALPTIGQADMLSGELKRLLHDYPSEAVATIGCSGGNGFAEAASAGVSRIVGIDINPQYAPLPANDFLKKSPRWSCTMPT
jgi:hypothetical protein